MLALLIAFSLAACSKIEELGSRFFAKSGAVTATVTVTGMTGQGLIIKLNDQLQSVSASSASFNTNLTNGDSYTVSMATQPILPTQVCSVSGPATAVAAAGQISIAINCTAPPAWAIQGTTTGYAGTGLQVQLNGGEIVTVTTSSFAFTTNIADNQQYNVQVKTNPVVPAQYCTAQRNVGLVTGANVADVSINCSTITFSVGGFISGLASGGSVTLQVNGTQNTIRSSDGFFTFTTKLADQTAYNITVLSQPTGQTCSVSSGAGILDGQGSYAATVQCSSTTHTISGTLSGLTGGYTTLVTSTGEFLPVTANGAFSFTKNFATNSNYVVEVFRNPAAPAQTCTVANGTGTITSNISNVNVSCTANGYAIGGTSTISGLTSSGLVLRLNGSSDVLVPANATSFSFNETVADGSSYTVTIAAQPAGQKCTLSNSTGTAGATVTNVTVSCVNGYTVGGTVTGYTGSNLVLRNTINSTPLDLVISSNSAFTFPGLLVGGDTYAVSIANYPETPYQNCSITSGSGTVAAANITNISITCTNVTLAFTAVSSNPTEAAGAHNVGLSLSGATPRAGSVDIVISGGSATNTLDYTLAATTISWNALTTPGNVVANIIDDAFNEGTETIQISLSNPVGITLGAQTTHTITITDNDAASAVGAVIATNKVFYYDADRNGKIDHVLIEFDKNVKDSTHTGWVNATTDFSVTGQWSVAGYSNVKFVPQYCLDRSIPANGNCTDVGDINNVVDDQHVVLIFDEGPTYDTGAAPQLTLTNVTLKTLATSPNDCYVHSSGGSCQSTNPSVIPTGMVDKADPILVAAWSDPIIDAWQLRLHFSEAVDINSAAGCAASALNASSFTYGNPLATGAGALRADYAQNNACTTGTDGSAYIIARVNNRFVHSDFNSDTIALSTVFYDNAATPNSTIATSKTITYDPKLEFYYPMDATVGDTNSVVKDVSGKGRDGTPSGGPKLVKDMGEQANQAYQFDGVDDKITVTGYRGVQGTGARSISAWVKTDGTKASFSIIDQNANIAGQRWIFYINAATSQLRVDGHSYDNKSPFAILYDMGWHHAVVTYDPADGTNISVTKLYIDGRIVTPTSAPGTINTTTNADISIGFNALNTVYAKGKIDEMRYYSRALSASEIQKLATKVPSGLVAQYPLDDNLTSGSVVDLSGNGNDAAINGNPLPAPDRYGRATSAYLFDGTGDLLRKTSANALSGGASPRTVCGWFSRSNVTGSVILADTGGSTATVGNMFRIVGLSGGQIKSDFYTSANSDSAASSPAGTWSHVCGVYDGSNNKSYLNGQESPAASYTATASATAIALGGTMDFTNILVGSLDDVQIYNRALTAGEVKALATELDRGLVAYYPLDDNVTSGTVADYSGSGNDLTINGTPAIVSDRLSNPTAAYSFNSSTKYLQKSSATGLPSGSADRSMCAWARVSTYQSYYQGIMQYGSGANTQASGLTLDSSNRPSFNNWVGEQNSPILAALGTWYHSCAVSDSTSQRLYVNGNLESSGSLTLATSGTTLRVGRNLGSGNFDGGVDDVRIYNRALSVTEIRELSGFAPGQLSGNTLWLDAGRAVFNDAGTTLATATQTVQQWNDISFTNGSANAFDVTQTTAASKPTWQSSVVNNMPVIRFDGTDDKLSKGSITGSTLVNDNELTVFFVQYQNSSSANNTTYHFGNTASEQFSAFFSFSNLLVFDHGNTSGGGRATQSQPSGWDNAFHLSNLVRTTANNAWVFVDGTQVMNKTFSANFTGSSPGTFWVGMSGSNNPLQGDIAELIMYRKSISAEERDKVTCYLSKKYGIAVTGVICD